VIAPVARNQSSESTRVAKAQGSILDLLKATVKDFGDDECGVRSAALAYYTIFALPPLLILLVKIAGAVWSPQDVQGALEGQFGSMLGESGKAQIHQMMAHGQQAGGGLFATIASTVGLILGAAGLFLSLQEALNRAWEVKPDPAKGGARVFILKRLLSMGMVLGIGFLLAVSLALTAGISAMGGALGGAVPEAVLHLVTFAVSFVVLSLLFAALFKFLPDAKVAWSDVWVGGAVTGLLFVIGKFALGIYLGRSKPGDAFGAASALAAMLVWAYYAGMILLLGAEFTQQWVKRRGTSGIEPKEGAVRVVESEDLVRPGEPGSVQGVGTEGIGKAASVRAATTPRRSGGGGIGDWILGLPVLYLVFRRTRNGERR
jgi:membrane protein